MQECYSNSYDKQGSGIINSGISIWHGSNLFTVFSDLTPVSNLSGGQSIAELQIRHISLIQEGLLELRYWKKENNKKR